MKLGNLILILISLVFLTSSFDVFLNLRIGGFSLRFAFFVIMILLMLGGFIYVKSNFSEKIKFLGLSPFILWVILLIIFIPNTTILSRNIGYMLWLLLLAGFIFILPIFVKEERKFLRLINIYLNSFSFVGLFGLVQFILGFFGISVFIAQYWENGKLPRINGFSYEPSYFTTYLLISWAMSFFLLINPTDLSRKLNVKIHFVIATLAIIFSTSRMGLIFMLIVLFIYSISVLKNIVLHFKINKRALPIIAGFLAFISVALVYMVLYFEKIKFIFNGLGIFGTAAHSSGTRMKEFMDTLKAFLYSPIIGYSLGGIPSAIANVRGVVIKTQVEAKDMEGMNVFAEVLAASGIFGFVFFVAYLFILFYKSFKMSNKLKRGNSTLGVLMVSLLMSLIIELLILSMNQNILRPYLWIHIAVINLCYFIGLNKLKELNEASLH